MLRSVLIGAIAGAAGTVALDMATYADMAIRGRSSSNAPAQLVEKMAVKTGLRLSSNGTGYNDQVAKSRESGLGALLGYINGVGTGILYGVFRSQVGSVPAPLAWAVVGMAAMAESDVPLITSGVSNPKTWGVSGWVSDVIPHLIYGLVTVFTYEALAGMESK